MFSGQTTEWCESMKWYSVLTPSKWKCSRWCLVSFFSIFAIPLSLSLMCVAIQAFSSHSLIIQFPCILNRGWISCTLATDGLDADGNGKSFYKLQPCEITINHIQRISLLQIRMNEFIDVLDEGYNFLHSYIFVSFSVQRFEGDRTFL